MSDDSTPPDDERPTGQSTAGADTGSEVARATPDDAADVSDVSDRRPPGSGGTQPIHVDRLFELLASPGNRYVLTYVLRADAPVEYVDLVEYVVARAEPPAEMTEAKFRGHVAATLINERLPELGEAGLVEVDATQQTVSPTPTTSVAAPHLALALSELLMPRRTGGTGRSR